MLAWFDKKGVLKEQLDSYGNRPRVGSQLFKIMAYFNDIDPSIYGTAYIRFQRPDFDGSDYPVLFMVQDEIEYQAGISSTESSFFEAGETYPCYVFDFSSVKETQGNEDPTDDNVVTLLDTPGAWKATITLVSSSALYKNVVGTIMFYVEGGDGPEEPTVLSINTIAQNFADALAQKLNVFDLDYLRVCSNFEQKAENAQLLKAFYKPNSYVFDDTSLGIYKILTVSNSEVEGAVDYVSATYEKIIGLVDEYIPSFAIARDALTNINGWQLTSFRTNPVTLNGYPAIIIMEGLFELTEERARDYLQCLTGYRFLPVYDYHKPRNCFIAFADGTIWKPQYDDTNGLVLWKVSTPFSA